ncbi:putative disease resistance protein At1g59780 [Cannabis sativa]|uniref:putative disease resistance protein At1g59780 n=1 Tax=Cannabis sativa TaxID=3483 RepID=UPI0029CA199F|nr:putative disease resistance protein At1g59780 [Cannabis sativa]
MLKKCSGLPLAIIVLAGLLSKKHTLYQWELMKENVIRCIGQGNPQHDDDSKYCSVSSVLGLSYSECHDKTKRVVPYTHSRRFCIVKKRFCGSFTLRVSPQIDIIIPNSLWKLEKLRHLYFSNLVGGIEFGKFLRSIKSRNFQTLVGVRTKDLFLSDILQQESLKKLRICVDRNFETFLHNPQTLTFTRLFSLQVYNPSYINIIDIVPFLLSCPCIYKLRVQSPIVRLPQDNQFSPNLIKLQLSNRQLKDDPMPTLEKLPKLRVLRIDYDSFMGEEMVCSRGGFPRLESLQLTILKNLKEWKVEENALCRLGYLRIGCCCRLTSIPNGLRNISTLNEMVIENMPKKFKERMEQGGAISTKSTTCHHVYLPTVMKILRLAIYESKWENLISTFGGCVCQLPLPITTICLFIWNKNV